MTVVLACNALPKKGWTRDNRVGIGTCRIGGLHRRVAPALQIFVAGRNLPGPCNAHSHAIQCGPGG